MKNISINSYKDQQARLHMKSLSNQIKNAFVEGTGMSRWEAQVGVDFVEELIFKHPHFGEARPGVLRYLCVDVKEGPGKPLKDCQMQTVLLSVYNKEDTKDLHSSNSSGRSIEIRRRRLCRIADEAKEQGGYLTQEDLAEILMCDVRTIRRDVKELKNVGIVIPTRGQQRDIGPGITHRQIAIRLWLEGKEPVEICKYIKHSMSSVENYLQKFKRVAYIRQKGFDLHEIAVTVGISPYATEEFLKLYEEYRSKTFFKRRMQEIELIGGHYWRSQDEKKTSQQSSDSTKREWRKL